MATKIILTVDEDLTAEEQGDLQNLLCDAFGEFETHRYPAEQYVDRRYPAAETSDWLNRAEKVKQVARRCRLARKLHTATFSHVLEPEPRAEKRAYDAHRWLQETFGMSPDEARATYNQLEDKRISKLMADEGLVKS